MGRGRPRKSITDSPTANEVASSPVGPKRGRGRPRKVQSPPPTSTIPTSGLPAPSSSKRGRGRPRKDPNSLSSAYSARLTSNYPYGSSTKKSRGRPREDADAATPTTMPTQLKMPKPLPKPLPKPPPSDGPAKRPRGRPRNDGAPPNPSTATLIPPLNLRQCRGSYTLTCPVITKQWDNTGNLSLDICDGPAHGTLQAAMNLGIVEGTMILSIAKDSPIEDETRDMDSEESDDGDEEEPGSYGGLGKRKGAPSRPNRPEKVRSSSPSRRLHLRWRGRDTSTGEIYYDTSPGFIEFNNNCTSISGTLVYVPAAGTVEFKGQKIDKAPRSQPEPWDAFSEAA